MPALTKSILLKYYKRREIQEAIVEHARDKEVGVRFMDAFGKRPDTLMYPREVLELALKNATSFHASEERWSNPLSLNSSLPKAELQVLRTGWDLVLDIDCKIFEYSRICADLIVKFLRYCEVRDVSSKFSGNKGFHIGIPFEAFPQEVRGIATKSLFPEAAKKIAFYVKEHIAEELGKQILSLEKNDFGKVKEKVNLPAEDIIRYRQDKDGNKINLLNVDKFLEIDTILISSRHLYRMPYSLHEKSGLVSLPVEPDSIMQFEKGMAAPELIVPKLKFLERSVRGETGRRLLLQALDYEVKLEEPREVKKGIMKMNDKAFDDLVIQSPIKEDFFPPCLKLMLQGMNDGKKRAIFCMSNFLGKLGWNKEQIEEFLYSWNKEKNNPPLREVYLKGQLQHLNPGERLPPNCNNEAYYLGLGICQPDSLCRRIRNPVNYTLVRWKRHLQDREEEEQKGKRGRKKKNGEKSVQEERTIQEERKITEGSKAQKECPEERYSK